MIFNPTRGDVWLVDLDPIVGHEEAKKRPCLVLSNNTFNESLSGLVIVIPITSTHNGFPLHITVRMPEGGLIEDSYLMCEQIRCVSIKRFSANLGKVNADTLHNVENTLKTLLDF
jgi:mRNA interferase MazF